MFVVIVGSGRTGSKLAGSLSKMGHDVVIVDKDSDKFSKLPIEYSGFKIEGDALELEVLKNARIDQADVIVVTTDNDKVNYMVTQMARLIFNVPRVLVRVIDPDKGKLFEKDPAVETYSPLSLLVHEFEVGIERNDK